MAPQRRQKQVIGVSGISPHSPSVRAMIKQIRDEGATALFLSSRLPSIQVAAARDIGRIDALVVMGNTLDIDPKCYIGRYAKDDPKGRIHPQTKSELATPKGKARARYEEAMIKKALACGMPLLGICGGMQRINILCGGTLHQHIPDLVGCNRHMQHKNGIAPHIPVVAVVIKEQTQLAGIACGIKMPFATSRSPDQPKVIMENSLHHQAIDRIGSGLRVCAISDTVKLGDGRAGYLAEAIETDPDGPYGGQCILGVQWHPEFGASSLGQRIVQHLITAARRFSGRTPRLAFRQVHATSYTP